MLEAVRSRSFRAVSAFVVAHLESVAVGEGDDGYEQADADNDVNRCHSITSLTWTRSMQLLHVTGLLPAG
jgi:hypothetical protein